MRTMDGITLMSASRGIDRMGAGLTHRGERLVTLPLTHVVLVWRELDETENRAGGRRGECDGGAARVGGARVRVGACAGAASGVVCWRACRLPQVRDTERFDAS